MSDERRRPTAADLAAARGRAVPDVVAPGLRVLFCGINPSLYSAAVGHHFARPGNRFWPTLHGAGFTDRRLSPFDDALLPGFGLGCTNLVPRATARADELTAGELRQGAERLRDLVRRLRPAWLAVLGVSAYRAAFDRPSAATGPQPAAIGRTRVWLLPNPSGLNAHCQLPGLVAEYRRLRVADATRCIDPDAAHIG
ncbi:MAG TPA: G/U mismatch-specific DNA glycosylase [Candidatus Eisenbacteria bacterium]|nr:G/U mismatch-specific DNA glycosylase [Candidatus Eisenbacteria bacterium]